MAALAMLSAGGNCNPAPDSVLRLTLPRVFFSGHRFCTRFLQMGQRGEAIELLGSMPGKAEAALYSGGAKWDWHK